MILAFLMFKLNLISNTTVKNIVLHYQNSKDNKVMLDKTNVILQKIVSIVSSMQVEDLFGMDVDEYGEYYHSSFMLEIKKELGD